MSFIAPHHYRLLVTPAGIVTGSEWLQTNTQPFLLLPFLKEWARSIRPELCVSSVVDCRMLTVHLSERHILERSQTARIMREVQTRVAAAGINATFLQSGARTFTATQSRVQSIWDVKQVLDFLVTSL
jgi:hypothetical protein